MEIKQEYEDNDPDDKMDKAALVKLVVKLDHAYSHPSFDDDCNRTEHERNVVQKKNRIDGPPLPIGTEVLLVSGEQKELETFMDRGNFENCDTTKELDAKTNSNIAKDDTSSLIRKSAGRKKIQAEGYEVLHGRTGRDSFICYNCKYTDDCKSQLISHMKLHQNRRKVYNCYKCDFKTYRKKVLFSHLREYQSNISVGKTVKPYVCRVCHYKTESKSNFDDHLLKSPKRHYSFISNMCVHCKATYYRRRTLDEHILRKHPEFSASVTSVVHQCPKCDYKTTQTSLLACHSLKHPETASTFKFSKCMHCNAAYTSKRMLNEHIVRKHSDFATSVSSKIYGCIKCTYKTIMKQKFEKHLLSHPGMASNYKLSSCSHCNRTFRAKWTLDNHIIRKHTDFIATVSSKIHECTKCSFKTTRKSGIVTHNMYKHPEIGNFELKTCVHCKAVFKSLTLMNNHIIRKHPKFIASVTSKIHVCKNCEYKTTLKSNLTQHIKSRHTEIAPLSKFSTCIHCKAIFSNKGNLDDHIIKNHPDRAASVTSKILKCTICDYKTTKRTNINKHLLIHSKKAV